MDSRGVVPRLNLWALTLADPPCEPQGLRTDAEESRRLVKVEQLFRTDRGRSIDRNLVMGPEHGYARTGPAVAVPGQEIIRKPPKAMQRGSPLSSCPRWQA